MTTAADRNDLMPAQEKLEWVTPKISLMGAEDTDRRVNPGPFEVTNASTIKGPS